MIARTRLVAALAALSLATPAATGCRMGPDYERPAIDTPELHRSAESDAMDLSDEQSLADLEWWELFEDTTLQGYIHEALGNNWDIRIAVARVLQAGAAARVSRSALYPTIVAGGELVSTRSSEKVGDTAFPGVDSQVDYGTAYGALASYEIDLWGRIRRANEAAFAQLAASQAAHQTVRQTLVAQVAAAYLSLLELDHELDIAERTLAARRNSLTLTTAREEGGVASLQDVRQSEILVATALASIADIQRRIEQQENELCVLLGRNPGVLVRGTPFTDQRLMVDVPPGLPSSLLERRPDLRAAEERLVAANASIGEAKAAFFPELLLTGSYGYQSSTFSDLFTSPARVWQFGPTVTLPLFTGGALTGNLEFAQARFEEELARYQQAVQSAFREVSDSLIARQRTREFRMRQEERTEAHRSAADLANIRYEGGVTSYLEVLYNEQELFDAELNLAQARLDELLSVIQLYRTLGGGWDPDSDRETAAAE